MESKTGENQRNMGEKHIYTPADIVVIGLAFLGAVACVAGSMAIFSQPQYFAETSLWPLPGLVLVLWAAMGLFSFLATYLSIRRSSLKWLKALIFLTGSFIPLIIIGAFSIGSLVMIGFLFFMASMLVLGIRNRARFLESFGLLMLGAIGNLGLLYAIITLGGSSL
jgi:hypothetical protein